MSTNKLNIDELVRKGEGDMLEFKLSFADIGDILRTICAFANHKGGVIIVGVSDEGQVAGVEVDNTTLNRLENTIREAIEPKVYPTIRVKAINNKTVVIIQVPEGVNKPYFYRGVCYTRIETVTRSVGRNGVIEILKSKISFDGIELREEVNVRGDLVEKLVERARRHRRMKISFTSVEDVLRRLGVRGKRAMALLFSDDIIFPQATIKCAAFRGKEKIDDETIYETS